MTNRHGFDSGGTGEDGRPAAGSFIRPNRIILMGKPPVLARVFRRCHFRKATRCLLNRRMWPISSLMMSSSLFFPSFSGTRSFMPR